MRARQGNETSEDIVRPRALRCLVMIGDGRRALLLEDRGTRVRPRLKPRLTLAAATNPPTSQQGTDRPGRSFQSVGRVRSAMEQTDWHEQAERAFAREVLAAVDKLFPSSTPPSLLLVAPPKILACWREHLPHRFAKVPLIEIDKDLSGLPIAELEQRLAWL
jgi:protein required for attachment to host cells